MIDIRLPNITGKTDAEQLAQIKSYLYQFAGQLQWALSTVETGNSSNAVLQKNNGGTVAEKESPGFNFNQLKGLIIKSADIIEAYYDEITKLIDARNRYAAYSDFGTFVEETHNVLYGDGNGITQKIDNIQQIFGPDGKIKAELLVNGHIYSGIIEYAKDGEAVVGIEIGQTTTDENGVKKFDKFAKFTANKLSFYDANETEVAYISDYKMVITEAWVKSNLWLGGIDDNVAKFVFDTSNGIALRPV